MPDTEKGQANPARKTQQSDANGSQKRGSDHLDEPVGTIVPTSIEVLVCSFRRPQLVQTLTSIDRQCLPDGVTIKIIIADNDDVPSARNVVEDASRLLNTPMSYLHVPARNISLARNACLDAATAPWVAFIDDDETASETWLAELLATAVSNKADAVFGPSKAIYDPDTPAWIRAQDYHSSIPKYRGSIVETGHTGNVLMNTTSAVVKGERFTVSRGQFQGEDVEFFCRLFHKGARFAISKNAIVTEPVSPNRLTYSWIASRKYGAGQSYAFSANGRAQRMSLFVTAAAKAAVFAVLAIVHLPWQERRNYWALRSAFHRGTCAGCLSLAETRLYGSDT